MWKYKTRSITFSLCVDDLGVKYFKKDDALHLKSTLEKIYTVKIDWTGGNYLELQLDWHYEDGFVDISMPDYITKLLEKPNPVV